VADLFAVIDLCEGFLFVDDLFAVIDLCEELFVDDLLAVLDLCEDLFVVDLLAVLDLCESLLVVVFLVVQISFMCYHCLLEAFLMGLFAVMTMVFLLFSLGFPNYGKTVPQFSLTEVKP